LLCFSFSFFFLLLSDVFSGQELSLPIERKKNKRSCLDGVS